MDKEQAILKFIRENRAKLTDINATPQTVKALREKFIQKNRLSGGSRFNNKDIAKALLIDLIDIRKDLERDKLIQFVKTVSIINEEITEDLIVSTVSQAKLGESSLLTDSDLAAIGKEEHKKRLQERFELEAKQKAEQEYEIRKNELELKMKEVEVLASELDSLPPGINFDSLISDDVRTKIETNKEVWWKELGLEINPFSTNQGLNGIPYNKYDDVIVRTSIIKSYLEKFDRDPEEFLGKTIVVTGEFGSGKTTLFQMLAQKAALQKVFPIFTVINPDELTRRLLTQLTAQIRNNLRRAYGSTIEQQNGISQIEDDIGQIIELMSNTQYTMELRGFVIFIDGLHKSNTYLDQILEFLRLMQNFQERASYAGVNCGIIVAGSINWDIQFASGDPSLSGTIYKRDKVPILTEDQAVESVIRRINSFVQNGKQAPTIAKDGLRTSYRVLSSRLGRPPTFREYLDHMRDRLVAKEYANVGISVISHVETIENVQNEIRGSKIEASIGYIKGQKPTDEFYNVIRDTIQYLFRERKVGVSEQNAFFKERLGVFHILYQAGMIVKRKDTSGTRLVWHLSDGFYSFLSEVKNKYNIGPDEVIESLFINKAKRAEEDSNLIYKDVETRIQTMVVQLRSSWPEVSAALLSIEDKIKRIDEVIQQTGRPIPSGTIYDLEISLRDIIRTVLFVLGDTKAWILSNPEETLFSTWCAPDNMEDYKRLLNQAKMSRNPGEYFPVVFKHSQLIGDQLTTLYELIQGEQITQLVGRELTSEELKGIHDARVQFNNQQYFDSIESLCGVIDKKIKEAAYLSLRCARGDAYQSFISNDILSRASSIESKGPEKLRRKMEKNCFYDISRSQYIHVLKESHNRKLIFRKSSKSAQVEDVLDSLGLPFALEDRAAHRDKPSYFRSHAPQIAEALRITPNLCHELNQIIKDLIYGDDFKYERAGTQIIFSFGKKDDGFLSLRMESEEVGELTRNLLLLAESERLTLPSTEMLSESLGYDPEKIIAILRIAISNSLVNIAEVRGTFGFVFTITPAGKEKLKRIVRS